ncbi:MAG: 5-oxoprolinase subunit PxpA [Rhodospirillaceae bacterium]|nr:5-oxoprolinase subunit PxpA [Rhodospirillaceae bacterium]
MMVKQINLNADMGESFGAYSMGNDPAMLTVVTSANVACGFHAGDPLVMRETVGLAFQNGVSVGAHPGFPDLQGFGRRRMALSASEVEAFVVVQIGALQAVAAAAGGRVTHVKPHGALSNIAAADDALATAIARAIAAVDKTLIFLAPACSAMARAGDAAGLSMAIEIFADRAYASDGQLVSRGQPGAMIHDPQAAQEHVLRMVREQALFPLAGGRIETPVDSICVHGDGPEALATARLVREGLTADGYALTPIPDLARLRLA